MDFHLNLNEISSQGAGLFRAGTQSSALNDESLAEVLVL
jgi:hypothetical protein